MAPAGGEGAQAALRLGLRGQESSECDTHLTGGQNGVGGRQGRRGGLTWPMWPSSSRAHPPATQRGSSGLTTGPPKRPARLPTCTGSSRQSPVRSAGPRCPSPAPAPQTVSWNGRRAREDSQPPPSASGPDPLPSLSCHRHRLPPRAHGPPGGAPARSGPSSGDAAAAAAPLPRSRARLCPPAAATSRGGCSELCRACRLSRARELANKSMNLPREAPYPPPTRRKTRTCFPPALRDEDGPLPEGKPECTRGAQAPSPHVLYLAQH